MKIEEQVLTVEQAEHLQELGLDMSDSAIWNVRLSHDDAWHPTLGTENCVKLYHNSKYHDCYCPTYTLQEVLDKLPEEICKTSVDRYTLNIDLGDREGIFYDEYSNDEYWQGDCLIYYSTEECSLIEAAYYMLCWVLENGYYGE